MGILGQMAGAGFFLAEDVVDWEAFGAKCYPKPEHRRSVDMDCFLANENVNDNDNQGSLRSKSQENHSENLSTFELSTDSKRSTIDDNLKSKMLEDIWAPLDVHETVTGLRGKLALAGNTWRARWKYRLFTDLTWLQALWIQAKGVLFEKEPKI